MQKLKASLQQRHHLWQQTCRFRSQSFGTRPQAKPLATSLTFGRGTAPNSLLTLANRIRVPGSHLFSQNAQFCHCHLASSPYLYPILSISCMLFLYSVEIHHTLIKFADTTLPGEYQHQLLQGSTMIDSAASARSFLTPFSAPSSPPPEILANPEEKKHPVVKWQSGNVGRFDFLVFH